MIFFESAISKFWVRFIILMIAALLGYFTVQAQKYPKANIAYEAEFEFSQKFEDEMHKINNGAWIHYFLTNGKINYYFHQDSVFFYDASLVEGKLFNISHVNKHQWWVDEMKNLHLGPRVWIPLGKLMYRSADGYMVLKLTRK